MLKFSFMKMKIQIINSFLAHSMNANAFQVYWNTEKYCRKFTKIMFSYVLVHEQVFVASLIYSFYCIFAGDLNTSKWPHIFNLVLPFDSTTLFGWYLMWFFQMNVSLAYTLSTVSTTSYFVCCCYYITTICDHFQLLIASIKETLCDNHDKNATTTNKKYFLQFKQQIDEAIELHVKLFE